MKLGGVLVVSTLFSAGFALAGIDSGGGISSVGGLSNASSIGSSFATAPTLIASGTNQTGLIAILYAPVAAGGSGDSNGNGLPDDWEARHNVHDPESDTDGDDANALEEYIAGTDPNSAGSVARVALSRNGSRFGISIPTVAGRNYSLRVSDDLKTWHELQNIAGDGMTYEFSFDPQAVETRNIFGGVPKACYFRVVINLAE